MCQFVCSGTSLQNTLEKDIEKYLDKIHPYLILANVDSALELEAELRRTVYYLPKKLTFPTYTVRRTWKLQPFGRKIGRTSYGEVPATLRPINIIQVHTHGTSGDLATIVCRGFDLKNCALSMTVTDDLNGYLVFCLQRSPSQ